MNYTKNFTRIILAAIGIFYIIKIIPSIIQAAAIAIAYHSQESFWSVLIGLLLISIAIFLLWYFFFHLRDWLTEKIIGRSTTDETAGQVAWFPAALRLSCIFAGLYCLVSALYRLIIALEVFGNRALGYRESGFASLSWANLIQPIIILALGVYLLFGAPHFVRWQVKKTLEQCRKLEDSEPSG